MARRLIGTGVTNAQGIATMNKDASGTTISGYTGTGAGHLQIIAVSGNIQSDVHDLYDVLIVDTGIDPGYTDIWITNSDTNLTRGNEYSTITETGTTYSALLRLNSSSLVDDTGVIEFDFYQVDGASSSTPFYIRSQTGGTNVGSFKLGDINEDIGEWVHIKIVFNIDKVKIYSPNTPDGYEITLSTTYESYGFAFSTPGTITTLRFKNFMIY